MALSTASFLSRKKPLISNESSRVVIIMPLTQTTITTIIIATAAIKRKTITALTNVKTLSI